MCQHWHGVNGGFDQCVCERGGGGARDFMCLLKPYICCICSVGLAVSECRSMEKVSNGPSPPNPQTSTPFPALLAVFACIPRYPLEQLPEAMKALLGRQVQGKAIITMGQQQQQQEQRQQSKL